MKKAKYTNSVSFKYLVVSFLMCIVLYAITIVGSGYLYSNAIENRYANLCKTVSHVVAGSFDADSVNSWLNGEHTHSYIQATNKLEELDSDIPDLESIAIYQMREDGMYTVYNTKSTLLRRDLGNVISYDNKWGAYKDKFLAGEKVENILVNGYGGKVLTYCTPVFDSDNQCVAYICSGISMNSIEAERMSFIKSFGVILVAIIAILYFLIFVYIRIKIVNPINKIGIAMYNPVRKGSIRHMRKLASNKYYSTSDMQKIFKSSSEIFEEKIGLDTKNLQHQKEVMRAFVSVMGRSDVVSDVYKDHIGVCAGILCRELSKNEKFSDELTDDAIKKIEYASPLHDIGKFAVPDEITYKAGKLTEEEFNIIKNHTENGAAIIEKLKKVMHKADYLDMAYDMALYHHEHYDGSGYPSGISGEDIPLTARIVAVLDAYDGILNHSCYHPARTPDETIEIMLKDKGHFDPDILNTFIKVKDQIVEEYNS